MLRVVWKRTSSEMILTCQKVGGGQLSISASILSEGWALNTGGWWGNEGIEELNWPSLVSLCQVWSDWIVEEKFLSSSHWVALTRHHLLQRASPKSKNCSLHIHIYIYGSSCLKAAVFYSWLLLRASFWLDAGMFFNLYQYDWSF